MKRDRERCLTLESSPGTRKTRFHCCLTGNMSLKPLVAAEGHMSEDGRWESPAICPILGHLVGFLSCPKFYSMRHLWQNRA